MSLHRSLTCAMMALVLSIMSHPGFAAEGEKERGPANVGKYDYPKWDGTPSHVNPPFGEGIPTDWVVGDLETFRQQLDLDPHRKERRPPGSKNIKWCAPLGSQTYGIR